MTSIKTEAKRIANSMYKEDFAEESGAGLRSLADLFYSLNNSHPHVTFEPFLECRGLLLEMVCLLSNPDISVKIQEEYYKNNAARIFREMIVFFDRLINAESIHKYLTWYNLSHFSGDAQQSDLDYIEQVYVKEEN